MVVIFPGCCDSENIKKFRDILVKNNALVFAFRSSAHYMNVIFEEISFRSVIKY